MLIFPVPIIAAELLNSKLGPFRVGSAFSAAGDVSIATVLVSEGVMVAPLRDKDGTIRLSRFTKIGSRFEREDFFEVPYLPMITGLASAL